MLDVIRKHVYCVSTLFKKKEANTVISETNVLRIMLTVRLKMNKKNKKLEIELVYRMIRHRV